jgi:hypothetical protein
MSHTLPHLLLLSNSVFKASNTVFKADKTVNADNTDNTVKMDNCTTLIFKVVARGSVGRVVNMDARVPTIGTTVRKKGLNKIYWGRIRGEHA